MRKQIFLVGYLLLAVIIFSCGKELLSEKKKEKRIETNGQGQTANGMLSLPEHCQGLENPCTDPACAPYFQCDGTVTYAGVQISYETSGGRLKFNSLADVNTVIDQLNTDYENYNNNYENQYSNLTADQLDSMDVINNFDEFSPIRQFEARFAGFISKRSQIENIENSWLINNMTGTDPDDIDETFDDAENAICNGNYQVKVGSTIYQPGDGGLIEVMGPICITNKKNKIPFTTSDQNRKFKLKVAINSWGVRSGAKGKVVSFKRKGNGWKRARTNLAVFCGGTIYSSQCSQSFTFSDRSPSPSGFKKRKQLKVARHQAGSIWKTKYNELSSAFEAQGIATGTLLLQ